MQAVLDFILAREVCLSAYGCEKKQRGSMRTPLGLPAHTSGRAFPVLVKSVVIHYKIQQFYKGQVPHRLMLGATPTCLAINLRGVIKLNVQITKEEEKRAVS